MSSSDPSPPEDLAAIAESAVGIAVEAGDLAMSMFGRSETQLKPDGSEVTEADRRAEQLIRERLLERMPGALVLGEEFGADEPESLEGDLWVVDPIDGTTSFVLGLPLFATLVGLLRDGEPVVGVAYLPGLGETMVATRGAGCFLTRGDDRRQLHASGQRDLASAFISTSGLHASDVDPREGGARYRIGDLVRASRRHRPVLDCVQHMMVARGQLDLAVDAIMAPWDIAALLPCLTESGAVYASIDGRRDGVSFGGSLVSAATEELLAQALDAMRP